MKRQPIAWPSRSLKLRRILVNVFSITSLSPPRYGKGHDRRVWFTCPITTAFTSAIVLIRPTPEYLSASRASIPGLFEDYRRQQARGKLEKLRNRLESLWSTHFLWAASYNDKSCGIQGKILFLLLRKTEIRNYPLLAELAQNVWTAMMREDVPCVGYQDLPLTRISAAAWKAAWPIANSFYDRASSCQLLLSSSF